MSIFIGILTVLEVFVCLLLSLVVLMQKPRQEGLGASFGSGVMDQFAGAQTTNFLQRWTVYFGMALFGLTFLLAVLISRADNHKAAAKLVDPSDIKPPAAATTTPTPVDANALTPEGLKKIIEQSQAKNAQETKPANPAAAPAPVGQKPADAKPVDAKPAESKPAAPVSTPAPQQKPADATPAPAPAAPEKPADATPAPNSTALPVPPPPPNK
jgi:preprotein translocase subunit SecG